MLPDLPSWDYLPAVTRFHNWAEMAGIVFLAFLVIAEIAAYKYGHRKDDLTEQQQTATNQRHDEDMARVQHDTAQANERAAQLEKEAAALNVQAAQLQKDLERLRAPRNLAPDQIAKLIEDLRPFGPVTYDIAYPAMMEPGSFLVRQLIEVFSTLNWPLISYEGPLPKQEISWLSTRHVPGVTKDNELEQRFLAGVASGLIGIKISREFLSQSTLGQWMNLSTDLLEFGLYANPDVTDHRYDEHGQRLPTSEILHITIGSK